MVQWVKSLTAAAGLCRGVGSIPGLVRWVKGFDIAAAVAQIHPWPGNVYMPQVRSQKERERERKAQIHIN